MSSLLFFRITSGVGIIALILTGVSFFIAWKSMKISFKDVKTGQGVTQYESGKTWFHNICLLFCGAISIIMLGYEIFLVFAPIKFKFYQYGVIRIIAYIFIGAAVLGVSGDLGISSCAFDLFAGILNIVAVVGIVFTCFEWSAPNDYTTQNDNDGKT